MATADPVRGQRSLLLSSPISTESGQLISKAIPTGIRAVLDTNVVVSAFRSRSSTSPSREILQRWQKTEFAFIYQQDILREYLELLQRHGVLRREDYPTEPRA